ncbi:ephrin-A4 isoform X1 [Ictalurus furcatus]|uniref:ephrin-A4 isoform X1 n=1 Tax=Ictalurus furcatus TaxID=66913 RepID=UPI00234FD549|nr:ephrin-A4 isoform X1 [Ictalurus furcatus]
MQIMSFLQFSSGPSHTFTLLILLMHVHSSAVAKRHMVYWNSTNTRLTSDDYSVQVNLNDYLDILCPHYPSGSPQKGPPETLALYLVAENQFQGCHETEGAIKRWECNSPYAPFGPVRFSEKIQRFTPFSLGFEFLPGHHYYYSSLSVDDGPPLPCMKLKVTVCCESTATVGKKVKGTPAPHSFAQPGRTSPLPVLALTSFSLFCLL